MLIASRPAGRPAKYPWKQIAVGESFFAPNRTTHAMHGCAIHHKPKKFSCKEVIKKGVFGTRVWRIA